MPVYCKEDMAALYGYMLSEKRLRDKAKQVSHTKITVDRTNCQISSSSKNETQERSKVTPKSVARPQLTYSRNDVKHKHLSCPDPKVLPEVHKPIRHELSARAQTMHKNEMKPQVVQKDDGRLRQLLSSSSSTSSTKNVSTSSSSTSNGDGIKKGKSVVKNVKPPALPVSKKTLYPSESVIVGWRMNVPIGSGFVNLGNTCYLNSTLQALFHVPSFVYWLTSDDSHARKCEMMQQRSKCLICPMVKTIQSSHSQSGGAVRPSEIYSRLRLICKHLCQGSQEDAHEFLRYLLEGMERSYLACYNTELDNLAKETTPIGQIFGGYIRTEVTCLECQHVSTTFQHFQDLILDIQSASSVDEALEQYFAKESLGDEYKCEKCKKRVAATKKFSLEKPPKVLCVQLKRFEIFGGKNNKHVSLKQWVDMEKFLHGSRNHHQLKYKLVSMILHHGYSSSRGHYTAVGLTSAGGYYLFDDSSVTPMPLGEVLKTNPYILMYELNERTYSASTSGSLELPRNATRTRRPSRN